MLKKKILTVILNLISIERIIISIYIIYLLQVFIYNI